MLIGIAPEPLADANTVPEAGKLGQDALPAIAYEYVLSNIELLFATVSEAPYVVPARTEPPAGQSASVASVLRRTVNTSASPRRPSAKASAMQSPPYMPL